MYLEVKGRFYDGSTTRWLCGWRDAGRTDPLPNRFWDTSAAYPGRSTKLCARRSVQVTTLPNDRGTREMASAVLIVSCSALFALSLALLLESR
jgi:hypothetical protein